MSGMYGAEPIIDLRYPDANERMYSCNGCGSPNVSSVLEVGTMRTSGRGGSTYVLRWCGACTRILKSVVSALPVPRARA